MTYQIPVKKGYIGDFAKEWWTPEDHEKWDKYVESLKKDGTYGEEYTITLSLLPNPLYDNRSFSSPLTSAKLEFIDLS